MMKNKFLAALLVVCLVLSVSAIAMAAGNEAIVNGVSYTNFMDAVAAANGTSYPVEVYGTMTVSGNFPDNVKVKIVGKTDDATLDLGNTAHAASGGILEFEDIKLFKPYNASDSNYKGFHHAAKEIYTNCTIDGEYWTYGNESSFTGCTFIQTHADRYNLWTYGSLNCTITDCTFKFASKSILMYNENKTNHFNLTVEGCEFITEDYVASDKAAIEIDSSLSTTGSYTLSLSDNKVDCLLSPNGENGMYRHKKGSKLTVSESGSELSHNYDVCDHVPPAVISFDTNGGTTVIEGTLEIPVDVKFVMPDSGNFTAPAGKQFKGFQFNGKEYKPGDEVVVLGDMVIKVLWEAIPATATPTPAPAAPAAPAPKTGDNTNIALWMSLMLISGVALLGLRKKAKAGK